MYAISLAYAKAHLSEVLSAVEAGQELLITRHGRAIARVSPAQTAKQPLPLTRLQTLRQALPHRDSSSAKALRALRDEG